MIFFSDRLGIRHRNLYPVLLLRKECSLYKQSVDMIRHTRKLEQELTKKKIITFQVSILFKNIGTWIMMCVILF